MARTSDLRLQTSKDGFVPVLEVRCLKSDVLALQDVLSLMPEVLHTGSPKS